MRTTDPTAACWRPTDLEAIRCALAIPVTPAAVQAINDEMAALERHYPDAIPGAKAHLDAIAALDLALAGAAATSSPPATEPVLVKTTRKGAAVPIPDELPTKKLDVIEYATELLLEEVSSEYALPEAATASSQTLAAQRRSHVRSLLLVLPRLAGWQAPQPTPYQGSLARG
jgi:hypothetical protein